MSPATAQPAPVAASAHAGAEPHQVKEGLDLIWQKLDGWSDQFIALVPNLVAAAIVTLVFVGLAWIFHALLKHTIRRAGRHDLAHVLASFGFWFVLFLGFLVVITILLPSMQPVDIFTSLGVGSVALGFALKDILQNWIAGFLILVRRPFHRGDQIKVGDIEGTVQAVETRATLVKTYSGRLVMVPNSQIYTGAVTVHTAYETRRTEIIVPVGLEVDLDKFSDVVKEILAGIPDVLQDPPPDVLAWEFKDNNVNFRVRWWTKSQRTYEVHTRAEAVRLIKNVCDEKKIPLPADTKISFAETPVFLSQAPRKKTAAKKSPPPKHASVEAKVEPHADERKDPEAEKPKQGELSEGVEQVPR